MINMAIISNLELGGGVPVGLIAMWSGSINAIPGGWNLCDGTNGTPDLRNRFIVGAGSSYTIGNTGGSQSVTLTTAQIPSHTHTATTTVTISSNGEHNHEIGKRWDDTTGTKANTVGSAWDSVNRWYTEDAGEHTHTATATTTVNSSGSGSSHENRPPYYALAYIMKMY